MMATDFEPAFRRDSGINTAAGRFDKIIDLVSCG